MCVTPCGLQILFDHLPDGSAHARHREGGQAGLGVIRRQDFDRTQSFGQGLGDFLRVPRGPDAGAVDAAASAVEVDALDHQIQVVLPAVDQVVAQQDLGEAGTMRLDARVAAVLLDRRRAAEDHGPLAARQHGGTGRGLTRIESEDVRLARPPQ